MPDALPGDMQDSAAGAQVAAPVDGCAPAATLLWIGSAGGMEQSLVEHAQIAYRGIDTGQLRGKNPFTVLANLGKMVRGYRQSLTLVREFQPDVCFVTGGYVCAPVVLACRRRGIPVLIYLPDMTPGWAILWLSKLVQRVAVSFPAAAVHFGGEVPTGKAVVTGYPVRPELIAAAQDRAAARTRLAQLIDRPTLDGSDGLPLVLIWGGSQGARSINLATWHALADLLPHAHVLHVVGVRDWPLAKEQMQNLRHLGVLEGGSARRYHPVDYLHDAMPLALAAADLTVARAGASILGEFPVAGLPSILAPLPMAGVNQLRNAEQLVAQGSAVLLDDAHLDADLARMTVELLTQSERRQAMSQAARKLAQPDAAQQIANELAALAAKG
jgi:UDP-N-acetylglucosamine--N-acetylmuramyl-(pentapeptide) pyrophosphoryl-undecaprenol N-acetylglucosamine transferase